MNYILWICPMSTILLLLRQHYATFQPNALTLSEKDMMKNNFAEEFEKAKNRKIYIKL